MGGPSEWEHPMRPLLPCLAAAALIAGPAFAQTPAAPPASAPTPSAAPAAPTQPGVTPPGAVNPIPGSPGYQAPPSSAAPASPAPTASTGSAANTAANAGASTTLMSGMSVKDSTGALIGEVKSIKGSVATIQMGSDTFTVDTDKLGVSSGVANINASQAELKKMLPPKK